MKRVIAILLAAAFLFALPACKRRDTPREENLSVLENSEESSRPEEPSISEQPSEEEAVDSAAEAEQAVRDLCTALQSGDREDIERLADYANLLQPEEGQSDDIFLSLLKHLQFEIISSEENGASVTVKTRFTNIDMHNVWMSYIQQCMELEFNNNISENPLSLEQMEQQYHTIYQSLLEQNAENTLVRTVDIVVVSAADQWRVQPSEALRTALLGDYFSAVQEVQQMARGG